MGSHLLGSVVTVQTDASDQVHEAQLRDSHGGHRVAVKVQHKGTKAIMSADLANMRLCCSAMEALHVSLGFDLASVVREYCKEVGPSQNNMLELNRRIMVSSRPGALGV